MFADAARGLPRFVADVYNSRGPHSALSCRPRRESKRNWRRNEACPPHAQPEAEAPSGGRGRPTVFPPWIAIAEEAAIRRALEPIPGVESLSFQLSDRTYDIDASDEA